jgi:hypothetical protein
MEQAGYCSYDDHRTVLLARPELIAMPRGELGCCPSQAVARPNCRYLAINPTQRELVLGPFSPSNPGWRARRHFSDMLIIVQVPGHK